MREHSKDGSEKLMCGSHNCLSEWQSFISSSEKISSEDMINPYNIDCYDVNHSSKMSVTSFRDFAFAFKLARLIHRRVYACIGNQFFMRLKVVNFPHFSQKSGSSCCINSVNGGKDLKVLKHNRLAVRGKQLSNFIQSFHKMKQGRDFSSEYDLFSYVCRSHRRLSSFDYGFYRDRDFSALAGALKSLSYKVGFRFSDSSCRRKLHEEVKHSTGEDITDGFQLREEQLKEPFNFIFCRGNKVTQIFSFPCDISELYYILRGRELLNLVFMDKEEFSDGKGIFSVCFGFSERKFREIGNKQGVNDDSFDAFVGKEGEQINMVTARGFHPNYNRGEYIAGRNDSFVEFRETRRIHTGRQGKTDITVQINSRNGERVFGDINTYEDFKHNSTSRTCLDRAGDASRPILQGDEGLVTQSTYNGFGRQGTNSSKGSLTQVNRVLLPVFFCFIWVKPMYINFITQILSRR